MLMPGHWRQPRKSYQSRGDELPTVALASGRLARRINSEPIRAHPCTTKAIPRSSNIIVNHTSSTNPFVHHQTPPRAPQTFLPTTHNPQTPLRITKPHPTFHKPFCQSHTTHKPLCASPNPTSRSTNFLVHHTRSTKPFAYHQTSPRAPQTLLSITHAPQTHLRITKTHLTLHKLFCLSHVIHK